MRPPHLSRASRMVTRLPALASSRAAIRPAAPAPMTTMWAGSGLAIWWLSTGFAFSRVLDPVAQKHRAALQRLAALQRHRRDRRALLGLRLRRVEHGRRPFGSVHRRAEDQIEFVDKSRAQEGAVGCAA